VSEKKQPLRLPLLLASLATLLLLFSAGLLLFFLPGQTGTGERQQYALDLSKTASKISTLVESSDPEWAQSNELAQLVAVGDTQVERLSDTIGVFGMLSAGTDRSAAREVNADWKLVRDGLLSYNSQISLSKTPNATADGLQTEQNSVQTSTEVPDNLLALATGFEQIRARVAEGTRTQSLIDLVNNSSLVWTQISNSQGVGLGALVAQQKTYADELLRLSGIGTDSSLYGYYTSNQILDYIQRVQSIQLPADTVATTVAPVVVENVSKTAVVPSSTFVSEALLQLQNSIAKFTDKATGIGKRSNRIAWAALAGLLCALMLLLSALWKMMRAASALKSVSNMVAAEPVRNGAMSFRDADQLIQDISEVASGDLRHSIRVPNSGHGKAIAESVNRSASVIRDLVGMTRGVAERIGGVVQLQDKVGRVLAEHDIKRQSETAELSDAISIRLKLLDQHQALLASTNELIAEIDNRSGSAVNSVNEVSSSLARVSAQVEVSSGRMHRLLQTAGTVTGSISKLKLLAEQSRLQALNVSLKISEQMSNRVPAREIEDTYEPYNTDGDDGLFDEIHQLTAKLVQMSADTDQLVSTLQQDIEETAQALKVSSDDFNESARHTHATSLVGKELAGFCEKVQGNIKEAISNLESQKSELSESAKRIVRLDKTGNDTSKLTLEMVQDVNELKAMALRLEESVTGFKMTENQIPGADGADAHRRKVGSTYSAEHLGVDVTGERTADENIANGNITNGNITNGNINRETPLA